jgi:hypothetical protein
MPDSTAGDELDDIGAGGNERQQRRPDELGTDPPAFRCSVRVRRSMPLIPRHALVVLVLSQP